MTDTPDELYSLELTNFDEIVQELCEDHDKLKYYFWLPNKKLVNKLQLLINKSNIHNNIIDVGCGYGSNIFSKADHILGKSLKDNPNNLKFLDIDLDFDKFLQADKYFNFVYCRHTLEDIQNPQNAFAEITRVGKQGYIETPSPLIEITKGADKGELRGYPHHRYIVWTDLKTNTLYFLPKYPIVEYLTIPDQITKKFNYILNNFSVYWNNYYIWDDKLKPNIVVYRNEINFNILKDYANLVNTAIFKSIENTNYYISQLKKL